VEKISIYNILFGQPEGNRKLRRQRHKTVNSYENVYQIQLVQDRIQQWALIRLLVL
jgi:hypothetical protein